MSTTPPPGPDGAGPPERRRNLVLRELLDEMLEMVRDLSRRAPELTGPQLEYAQERLEWLADEIYQSAIRPGDEERKR